MTQHFTFSPNEDGRPIVLDGKAVAYVEEGAPPMTGEILASSQDVREKLEEVALYLQTSLRLKGCRKAEKLADEAFELLAITITGGRVMTQPIPSETIEYERYVDGLRLENARIRHALTVMTAAVKQDLVLFTDQPHKASALGLAEAALLETSDAHLPRTMTIHVEGGMVQDVTGIPAGVEVRVEDYDHADDTQPTWDAEKFCHVTVYGGDASA